MKPNPPKILFEREEDNKEEARKGRRRVIVFLFTALGWIAWSYLLLSKEVAQSFRDSKSIGYLPFILVFLAILLIGVSLCSSFII